MTQTELPEYRNVTFDPVTQTLKGEHLMPAVGDRPPRYYNFSADLSFAWIRHACVVSERAIRMIWSEQDGYGAAGFTPAQGWDWSGIRDSSPAAIDRMLDTAKQFVSLEDMEALYGVSLH